MKIHWMVITLTFMRLAEAGWPCRCLRGSGDEDDHYEWRQPEGQEVPAEVPGAPTDVSETPETADVTTLEESGAQGLLECILDLDSEESENFTINDFENSGVSERNFMAHPGHRITSVLENGREIWKDSGNEKCTFVTLFVKDGTRLITMDNVKNGVFTLKHFEKVRSMWMEITQNDFLGRITYLRDAGMDKEATGEASARL